MAGGILYKIFSIRSRPPEGRKKRLPAPGLALLVLAGLFAAACTTASRPTGLPAPGAEAENLVGLALAEEVFLNVTRQAMVGLSPRPETTSVYEARVEPGGLEVTFRRRGPGSLYLAWVPADRLPAPADRIKLVLLSHQITTPSGTFRSRWPLEEAPLLSGAVQPGRVTYLGVVQRRLFPSPEPPGGAAGQEPGQAPPRVELAFRPDPKGRGILAPYLDNPWLQERLLNPPLES